MLEYNLTQRERQIILRLIELSRHSKDFFEARIVDPGATGPSREGRGSTSAATVTRWNSLSVTCAC